MVQNSLLKTFSFKTATRKIIFGPGASSELVSEINLLGSKHVFVITDNYVKDLKYVCELVNTLEKGDFEITKFTEIKGEPTIDDFERIAEFVRSNVRCQNDLVVGVGGGSVLDSAKIAAMAGLNTGNVKDYIENIGNKLVKGRLHLILVPTTAGTGSEVSRGAITTINGVKYAVRSDYLLPDVALIDPLLTLSMSPKLTAATGADALSHAIESMLSLMSNPLTDALAIQAVTLLGKYLRAAYVDGQNFEARYYQSLASLMAGMAFANTGTIIGHALAYTIAFETNLSHGASCGLALPYVMKFCLPVQPDKLIKIADAMKVQANDASQAPVAVKNLLTDIGLPTTLKEIGIYKEEIPRLAEHLVSNYKRLFANTPRETSLSDITKLLQEMYEGRI